VRLDGKYLLESGKYSQVAVYAQFNIFDRLVTVVCTHLKSNRGGNHENVRVSQAAILLDELFIFNGNNDTPTIICGDFNTDKKSPIYQLFKYKRTKAVIGPLESTTRRDLEQPLDLDSAYSIIGEPIFTVYTQKDMRFSIDFIWYTMQHFEMVEILDIPNEELLQSVGCLPSQYFPSDHIQLYSKLAFIT